MEAKWKAWPRKEDYEQGNRWQPEVFHLHVECECVIIFNRFDKMLTECKCLEDATGSPTRTTPLGEFYNTRKTNIGGEQIVL